MRVYSKRYSILISPPDLITYEPVEKYEEELLNVWIQASKIFKNSDFYYEDEKITIETDWSKIKDQLEFSIDKPGELILSVSANSEYLEELSIFFLNRYLEMMFITMNISTPGSLNIYNKELKNLDDDPHFDNWNISLSSSPFETFWVTSEQVKYWPVIRFIPLERAVDWYKTLDISFKQRASSNIEKCFFALINYCQGNTFSPSNFIWITHSLEALYDTPRSGITKSLKSRISLFLDESISHRDKLREKIGDLYNFRSEFVHGSMEIARSPFFENLDKELNNYMVRINDLSDFGIIVLLATIQKLVNKNAKELIFTGNTKFEIK